MMTTRRDHLQKELAHIEGMDHAFHFAGGASTATDQDWTRVSPAQRRGPPISPGHRR